MSKSSRKKGKRKPGVKSDKGSGRAEQLLRLLTARRYYREWQEREKINGRIKKKLKMSTYSKFYGGGALGFSSITHDRKSRSCNQKRGTRKHSRKNVFRKGPDRWFIFIRGGGPKSGEQRKGSKGSRKCGVVG